MECVDNVLVDEVFCVRVLERVKGQFIVMARGRSRAGHFASRILDGLPAGIYVLILMNEGRITYLAIFRY
jgi:hypothetical protein